MARTEEPAASPGTIRCPSCGHANRPDRRFCAKCGARLGDVCAACGTQNDPDENFCSHCGAALSAATALSAAAKPVVRQEPPEAEKLPAGERRQLTVVFCDLVGSTALSQQLDPEEWRAVVVQYLKAAAEAVARHGGHVAKTLGDGLLVYFGWPRAHEDDAERAVRAGLGIVDAVGALNRRLQRRLAVRIGMDTGLVVIGDDGELYGDAQNVAARAQAVAEPDTVLVTAATHRLVAGRFIVEARGAQALKGVRGPVVLYRVVQPSGVRSRLAAAAVLGLTPFVGREDERRLLRTRFEQAREGEGQVVLLVGEPGIGKSRLALALHEDLAGVPHTWLESGGQPYFADTPFYAVTELLRQLFAWTGEDTAEARVAALERARGGARDGREGARAAGPRRARRAGTPERRRGGARARAPRGAPPLHGDRRATAGGAGGPRTRVAENAHRGGAGDASIDTFHMNIRTFSTSSGVSPGITIFVFGSSFFGSRIQSFAHA